MKILLLLISLLSCECLNLQVKAAVPESSGTNAQIKVTEPEFSGTIVFVNDSVGAGVKLEQQAASMGTKASGSSYVPIVGVFSGKSTVKNYVKGASSPVQIDKKVKIQFIVKVADNSVDPVSVINIFRLNPEKDTRTIEVGSAKFASGAKTDIKFLPFDATKYGQNSYLITLENLEAGEYAMTLASRRDMFHMFGVK
jgi:hypothetical protein